MTTSLASCADTGVSLPRTEPGAPDPDIGCLADFLVRNNGLIRG